MTDEDYMRLALDEARLAAEEGEVPIGAVVVHEDEVIARVNAMDYDCTNQLMRRLLGAKPSCAVVSRGADQMQLI